MRFFKFGSGLFSTLISQLRPPISTYIVPAWISHNLFGNNIKSFYLPSLFVFRVAHHFINRNIVQVVRGLSYSLRDLFLKSLASFSWTRVTTGCSLWLWEFDDCEAGFNSFDKCIEIIY